MSVCDFCKAEREDCTGPLLSWISGWWSNVWPQMPWRHVCRDCAERIRPIEEKFEFRCEAVANFAAWVACKYCSKHQGGIYADMTWHPHCKANKDRCMKKLTDSQERGDCTCRLPQGLEAFLRDDWLIDWYGETMSRDEHLDFEKRDIHPYTERCNEYDCKACKALRKNEELG